MEQEKHNDTKEKESPKETDTQKETEPSKEESPKEKEKKEKHHKKHHPPNPNINKIHVCINKKIVDVVIFFQ